MTTDPHAGETAEQWAARITKEAGSYVRLACRIQIESELARVKRQADALGPLVEALDDGQAATNESDFTDAGVAYDEAISAARAALEAGKENAG